MTSIEPACLPARGGLVPSVAPAAPSMAVRRRAMMAKRPAMNPNMMKKGGKASCETVEEELKEHKAAPMSKAHKKATGGTIQGNVGKFAKTDMETADRTTKTKGTGGVKNGNDGGYADGGNVSKFVNTKMVDGDKNDPAKGTGGVKNGNAGGFAKGGTTGGVRKGNAGGYKEGGEAKKAYATGGKVDSGKAEAMPKKAVSRPVANSLQSGTFKRGGKVNKFADGDLVDASKGAFDKTLDTDEDMPLAKTIRSIPKKLYEGAKGMMGLASSAPKAGSITKTEKSVTVSPKKRGGRC